MRTGRGRRFTGGHCRRRHAEGERSGRSLGATAISLSLESSCWTITNRSANWSRWETRFRLSRACAPNNSKKSISRFSPPTRNAPAQNGRRPRSRAAPSSIFPTLWKTNRARDASRHGSSVNWDQAFTPEFSPGRRWWPIRLRWCWRSVVCARKAGAVKRVVATVFEPASEHGQKGMDELHEQTVNLLSFQQLPKKVFDTQVAFNMVARYGEQSGWPALNSGRAPRTQAFQRKIAGKDAPVPSLLLVQAPIFHGHAFINFISRLEKRSIDGVSRALAGEHVHHHARGRIAQQRERRGTRRYPGSVPPDPDRANGLWLWAAADNLRIAAIDRRRMRRTMAAAGPKEKSNEPGGDCGRGPTNSQRMAAIACPTCLSSLSGCGYHTAGQPRLPQNVQTWPSRISSTGRRPTRSSRG